MSLGLVIGLYILNCYALTYCRKVTHWYICLWVQMGLFLADQAKSFSWCLDPLSCFFALPFLRFSFSIILAIFSSCSSLSHSLFLFVFLSSLCNGLLDSLDRKRWWLIFPASTPVQISETHCSLIFAPVKHHRPLDCHSELSLACFYESISIATML